MAGRHEIDGWNSSSRPGWGGCYLVNNTYTSKACRPYNSFDPRHRGISMEDFLIKERFPDCPSTLGGT